MTEIIVGKRCSGKTTELIKIAARTGAYIVVGSKRQADCVRLRAKELGFDDVKVLDGTEAITRAEYEDIIRKGIVIDEIQNMLYTLHLYKGITILAVTITVDDRCNTTLRYLEVPKPETKPEPESDISKVFEALKIVKKTCESRPYCANVNSTCDFYSVEEKDCMFRLKSPSGWQV